MSRPILIPDSDDEVVYLDKANSIKSNNNNDEDKYYYAKRSKRDNVVGAWQPCELLDKTEMVDKPNVEVYIVKFIRTQQKKDVFEYELASRLLPNFADLSIGTRVIARRSNDLLPYCIDASGKKILLLDSIDTEFYPGIIAGSDETRFLVFFDDGMVQLVKPINIRKVVGNDLHHHAHWNAYPYFDWFLRNERAEAKPKIDQKVKVELNGNYEAIAKVLQIDFSVAQFHFEEANRFEWIYLGSPRIMAVYRELIKQKRLDKIIRFKTYKACRSANDDVVMMNFVEIPNNEPIRNETVPLVIPKLSIDLPAKHDCCHLCVSLEDKIGRNLEQYMAFQRPLLTGWKRFGHDKKYYVAPCGFRLDTLNEIDKFLFMTDSKLRIDCFDLSKDCDIPMRIHKTISTVEDVSRGLEKIPIVVRGQMTLEDKSFSYINNYNYEFVDELKNNLGRNGCNCRDNCRDKSKCSCWQLTIQRLMERTPKDIDYKNNAKVGYKHMRLQKIVYSGIVECGSNCECCASTCVNCVTQNGIQHKLEVFKTENRGWGVRATADIPEAMFICNYAGDVLLDSVADKRSTKYQFKVPQFNFDSDDTDSDNDYDPEPKKFRDRSHDVIQPFINYFPPSIQNGNANRFPDSEKSYSKSYIVDALYSGNVSRFINHSCDPNLFVQSVYVDDDKRFPWLGFFSSQPVKAGEELTIDYRYELIDGEETECLCGSGDKCRKRLT